MPNLDDHESRIRALEEIVRGFVERERGIILSLTVEARLLLLVFGIVGAIGAVVGIIHALTER